MISLFYFSGAWLELLATKSQKVQDDPSGGILMVLCLVAQSRLTLQMKSFYLPVTFP
jgi:hypothetical protein